MSNHHWRNQQEVGNRFFLSILIWIAFHLGRAPARVLLIVITVYFFVTGSSARAASRSYLRRALRRNPTYIDLYRHFYFFASVTLDRLFLLAGKFSAFDIDIHGEEIFSELKESKHGCLLFVSHIGSFDVMRVPGARDQALPISILMDRKHNSMAAQAIEQLDPLLAKNIIDARQSKPELVLKMNECIAKGKMIGIMVDRLHDHELGVDCSFLNGEIKMPAGPWQLAMALQVPIVSCCGLYHGKNKYSIHFDLVSRKIGGQRNNRSRVIRDHIQQYCTQLEYYLSLQPFNWFNFYEFWNNETTVD